jgi:hypothetical protein
MRVHERFHGVWVEAWDVLALVEEWWKAGRTGATVRR